MQYDWQELSSAEWKDLSDRERRFAHSFWGKIQLFCSSARYVNHSDHPNTKQDLKNRCDRALRPIKRGEEITTDSEREIRNELDSLLEAWRNAISRRDFRGATTFMADRAELVFNGISCKGAEAIASGYKNFYSEISPQIHDAGKAQWLFHAYGSGACAYTLESRLSSRGIVVLKRDVGAWRITYEHLSQGNEASLSGPVSLV